MKVKSLSLLSAALFASLTPSALAAPNNKLVPAPPPTMMSVRAPMAQAAVKPAAPEWVEVTPAITHVSRWMRAQRWADDMVLKPSQEKMQLRLLLTNGGSQSMRVPPMSWFRLKVNGEVIATEASLRGKRIGVVDVTGAIPPGANQVVIDAAGVPGSQLTWQITTYPIKVLSIEPKAVAPGATITLKGTGFPADVQQVNAIAGGSVADVIATSPTQMKIKLSDTTPPGTSEISLEANGLPAVKIPLGVAGTAAPVVSGTNTWCAPAGTQIKVSGKFFSATPAKNQVFFGPVAAQVVSVDEGAITVVVPTIPGKQDNVSISVVTNGKRSANSVAFTIGRSATDPSYVSQVKQQVKVGDGVTTQNSSQARSVTRSSATENGNSNAAGFVTGVSGSNSESQGSSQSGGFSIIPLE